MFKSLEENGVVVPFRPQGDRTMRRTRPVGGERGIVLLFTGTRYERGREAIAGGQGPLPVAAASRAVAEA